MSSPPGPKKFADFLKKHRISIRRAAEALHVSDPSIIDWRDGDKTPNPDHRRAIRVWTHDEIVEDDWQSEREAERAETAASVKPFVPAARVRGDRKKRAS